MSSTTTSDSYSDKTLNSAGNLIRVLPTGTVFIYQILNPLLTNGGQCSTTNKIISSILFTICVLSCFFSTFIDSYKDGQSNLHYGIATFKGFYPFSSDSSSSSSSSPVDFSSYKLQIGDFVHGLFALIIFAAIALLNMNTVKCFYPSFATDQKALLMALPAVLGTVSSTVFLLFPYKRRGIGYPNNLNIDQKVNAEKLEPLIADQKV